MEKYSVDCENLHQILLKKKSFLLSDVKNKIKKIAFDVVRFTDPSDGIEGLWKVQSENGEDYIVALYDEETSTTKTATASIKNPWAAITDRTNNIQIYFNQLPVTKISLASLSIPANEAHLVSEYLPSKLASNKEFRDLFINSLTSLERAALLKADGGTLLGS